MQNLTVKKYQSKDCSVWNEFVLKNKVATFLFDRDFMEYHSDRFQDFSLMVYKEDELIAIMPANIKDSVLYSHQGLTYGGLIMEKTYDTSVLIAIYEVLIAFLNQHDIKTLKIKSLPEFYDHTVKNSNKLLTDNFNATVYQRHKVLAIDFSVPFTIHKSKLKNYRKNQSTGFMIQDDNRFDIFWNHVLIPRLKLKHNTKPVHTLEEIELLHHRFPNQIKQYNIFLNDEILAGITIFDKGNIVKSQYGATTERGEKTRALEYLFIYLTYKYKDEGKRFFSMGTVSDNSNKLGYNPGLLRQKEELGCQMYAQEFLLLETQ